MTHSEKSQALSRNSLDRCSHLRSRRGKVPYGQAGRRGESGGEGEIGGQNGRSEVEDGCSLAIGKDRWRVAPMRGG